jgi:hypothetical protein
MVMVLPAIVAVAVAGGLLGGPAGGFSWARRAVAANSKHVQIKVCFIVIFLLRAEPCSYWGGPDAMIVAPHGYVAKAASLKTLL